MRNQCVLVFLLDSFLLLFGTTEAMASNILVRQGSRGPAVRQVQTLLIEQGWLTGAADGICGNQTVAAIKSFQKANGLDDDGVCGNGTYSVLSGGQEYLPSSDESDGTVMYVNATAYSADDPGNSAYTALGTHVRHGIIAVDPSIIPDAKIFSATRKLYEDILRSEREYPRQTAGGKQYVEKGV